MKASEILDIRNTALETVLINPEDLKSVYPLIDRGSEGYVYRYSDTQALKIFETLGVRKKFLIKKYEKTEFFGQISDESVTYPEVVVGSEITFQKIGYLMPLHPVWDYRRIKSIRDLMSLAQSQIIESLINASLTMKRQHEQGIVIGDVKFNNFILSILNQVYFIDTDNFGVLGKFSFDTLSLVTNLLPEAYDCEPSLFDNDIFLFAVLVVHILLKNKIIENQDILYTRDADYFQDQISLFDINANAREILECIFSDASDKPYVHDFLLSIDKEKPVSKILV